MGSLSSTSSIGSEVACGRSTLTPWVSMGAAIIKITSSTSMTSINGTTLISAIGRRLLPRLKGPCIELAPSGSVAVATTLQITMQDGVELLGEVFVFAQQLASFRSQTV